MTLCRFTSVCDVSDWGPLYNCIVYILGMKDVMYGTFKLYF